MLRNILPTISETRQWLSGFTGSAGTLVVGEKEAALFVDGRYFIQAEQQIAGSGITLMRMGTAGTPTLEEYLAGLLRENDALGVDFGVVSEKFAEDMRAAVAGSGALLRDTGDWFNDLWTDRPPMPREKAFILDEQYAGESVQNKVAAIRKVMDQHGAQLHVLNVLDDIAWVLNVRGGDVLNTPVVMSYLVIGQKHVNWFVDETKVDEAMRQRLADEGVNVRGYDEIIPALQGLEPDVRVLADAAKLTAALMSALEKAEIIRAENPSTRMKAIKNEVELANLRKAHVKDGAAVTHLMYWLKQNVGKIPMTEISVSDKMLALPSGTGSLYFAELQHHLRLSRQRRDDALQCYTGNRRGHRAARPAAHRFRRTVSGRHDGYHPHLCARPRDG